MFAACSVLLVVLRGWAFGTAEVGPPPPAPKGDPAPTPRPIPRKVTLLGSPPGALALWRVSRYSSSDSQASGTERGILNWPWVRALLSAIDQNVPNGSGASIALATRDVYIYLTNTAVRNAIQTGVRAAMTPGVETVVVGHSLGTIVAYHMLRDEGQAAGWRVPLFVTVGSPLAVTRIKQSLQPIKYPTCAAHWFNAMDPDDIVALYPLDAGHFRVQPPIENKTDVDNQSDNQHSITGYLNDKDVARKIYDALVGN